jgi:hypothetical protein
MFCNSCGKEIQPGQAYCGSCGAAIGAVGASPVASPAVSRVAHHRHLLAILWLVYAAFTLVGSLGIFFVANMIIGHMQEVPPPFLHPLLTVIGALVLVKGILSLMVGWGLLQRVSWGRVLAIVIGIISLFNLPFGTALGIYTLWVLMSRDAERDYDALVSES